MEPCAQLPSNSTLPWGCTSDPMRFAKHFANEMMQNEDVLRQLLRRCMPAAAARFGGTCREASRLAREEALWEFFYVRVGARYRPLLWASHAAAGECDELQPDSWRQAYVESLPLSSMKPGGRQWHVHSRGQTLMQALDMAAAGDVIVLAPGLYPHITLLRAVTLVGINRDCVEVASICAETDGAMIACLTVSTALKSAAGTEVAAERLPAVRVAQGGLRIFDCNIRGERGVNVEKGICNMSNCDVQVSQCCFHGVGELVACRLEGNSQMDLSPHTRSGTEAVASFPHGCSRITNCLINGHNTDVGIWIHAGAVCEVRDCDITASSYGILAEGARGSGSKSCLLLSGCRVHRCLGAGIRMEAAGVDVQVSLLKYALPPYKR